VTETLDDLDPPAWGAVPREATPLIEKCYALRRKPLRDFTVEDLRLGIGQDIGLEYLVPIAVEILRENPLAAGDMYAGDLLHAVLQVPREFWQANDALWWAVDEILDELEHAADVTREAAEIFKGALAT
jgi:hypothetical protein